MKALLIILVVLLVLAHPAAVLGAVLGVCTVLALFIARRRPFRAWLYIRRLA